MPCHGIMMSNESGCFQGHKLVGADMLPVVQRLMATTEEFPEADLAALRPDHRLVSYSPAELDTEFRKLTGYDITVVVGMARKELSLKARRLAVHCAIQQANEAGAPPTQKPVVADPKIGEDSTDKPASRGEKRVSFKV